MKRIAIGVLLAIVVVAIGHFYGPTIYRVSTDRPTLEAYLAEAGLWAPLVFVVLMATQVVVAPLPGLVVGLVGGYVFGAARGFLLNLAGFTLGAMIAFSLARYFGKPLVHRFFGDRYDSLLARIRGKRGALIIATVFVFPFAPDDVVCFLAALTPIRARLFAVLVLIFRTPGLLASSLTGAGVIDMSPEAWTALGIVGAILLLIAWRNKQALLRWGDRLLDTIGGN